MQKPITIAGIESDQKKVTILVDSGKTRKNGEKKLDKYKIWITKKDGSNTKAYEQFQKIRPMVGDTLEVNVDEKEAEYNGFPYVDRTILYFITDEHGTPPIAKQEIVPEPLGERIDKLEKRLDYFINLYLMDKPGVVAAHGQELGVPQVKVQSEEINLDTIPF